MKAKMCSFNGERSVFSLGELSADPEFEPAESLEEPRPLLEGSPVHENILVFLSINLDQNICLLYVCQRMCSSNQNMVTLTFHDHEILTSFLFTVWERITFS